MRKKLWPLYAIMGVLVIYLLSSIQTATYAEEDSDSGGCGCDSCGCDSCDPACCDCAGDSDGDGDDCGEEDDSEEEEADPPNECLACFH